MAVDGDCQFHDIDVYISCFCYVSSKYRTQCKLYAHLREKMVKIEDKFIKKD